MEINCGDELPEFGLPNVVEIIIDVDGDSNISDLKLHACFKPGIYLIVINRKIGN